MCTSLLADVSGFVCDCNCDCDCNEEEDGKEEDIICACTTLLVGCMCESDENCADLSEDCTICVRTTLLAHVVGCVCDRDTTGVCCLSSVSSWRLPIPLLSREPGEEGGDGRV